MAFYFVSTFANAQTPTKQRPYGYRGLKIFTSLKLRFQDFQRWKPVYKAIGSRFNILSRLRCNNVLYDRPEKRKPKQRGGIKSTGSVWGQPQTWQKQYNKRPDRIP
ncbi:hypothetical protein [Bathymodiolus japonicus methanotrophic gill symbiont]|uniref:hypothetical protein n=1 Tax=Bathymodiolus japonicus methanotrophic gill symbiont TaxID=113269 RepID=UPI001C8E4FF8|nr:hypothetical protein [Bathymodiolus japonicus methanotrophic gill symbiont]